MKALSYSREMKGTLTVLFVFFLWNRMTAQAIAGGTLPTGALCYDSSQTEPGITLLDQISRSMLVDMHGRTLKKYPFGLLHLLRDGTMLAKMGDHSLVKLDADLNIIWKTEVDPDLHHDIKTDENGAIYLLSSERINIAGVPASGDVIDIYSSEGVLIYTWRLSDHLQEFIAIISKSIGLMDLPLSFEKAAGMDAYIRQAPIRFFSPGTDARNPTCQFEFTHFNSIQVLPYNEVARHIPAFKKGNLLLSFNPYSCYGILDTASGKIEWAGYLPERTTLHSPTLLPNGHILVFQNSTEESEWAGKSDGVFLDFNKSCLDTLYTKMKSTSKLPLPKARPWTSVAEYDPVNNSKVWEYIAEPGIHDRVLGNAQRLANGNTLICLTTEEQGGKIIEVNNEGKIVWQYICPERNQDNHLPVGFYRSQRISSELSKLIAGRNW
jgi:hypothetical protein